MSLTSVCIATVDTHGACRAPNTLGIRVRRPGWLRIGTRSRATGSANLSVGVMTLSLVPLSIAGEDKLTRSLPIFRTGLEGDGIPRTRPPSPLSEPSDLPELERGKLNVSCERKQASHTRTPFGGPRSPLGGSITFCFTQKHGRIFVSLPHRVHPQPPTLSTEGKRGRRGPKGAERW